MARSDFTWINFDTQFTVNNPETTKTFTIEGNPVKDNNYGYLLIQSQNVGLNTHQILINGQNLPSFDIAEQGNSGLATTWMDRIPQAFFNQGGNRITIRRVGNDDFFVFNVMVQWREQD